MGDRLSFPHHPAATFQIGDKVRVRHGVMDTDFPDIPIGGWAETIAEVHDDGMFTVRWTEETLASRSKT